MSTDPNKGNGQVCDVSLRLLAGGVGIGPRRFRLDARWEKPMLIKNATIITFSRPNQILPHDAMIVQDGVIVDLGPTHDMEAKYPDHETIDARGQVVMPGNLCAHTHFYGAYARGMAIPGRAPADFPEILQKLWWGLDKALSLHDVYQSALVCLVDAVRHGTTTLIDHHASPGAIDGSLDEIARAVEQSGVRASLCYEVTDRDGRERAKAGIAENVRFIRRIRSGNHWGGRLAATFGLHASLTLSDQTLRECREANRDGAGFHIHVAEHPVDEYDSLEKCGKRVVDRLHEHRILGENSIAVHAVHVDAREIALLAESKTWVTHQPRSNMNNGVGLPEIEAMERAGIRVCLGNDGFSNAMWEEWKTAYLAHKLVHRDPRRLNGSFIERVAIYNNAALVSSMFGLPIGAIEVGARADLIFVDYHPYTPMNADNLPWHILFGFHESMVTSTIVDGKVLMRDRELLTLDEEKIAYETRKLVPDTWDRYQAIRSQMTKHTKTER